MDLNELLDVTGYQVIELGFLSFEIRRLLRERGAMVVRLPGHGLCAAFPPVETQGRSPRPRNVETRCSVSASGTPPGSSAR